jgi:hypothetical protein
MAVTAAGALDSRRSPSLVIDNSLGTILKEGAAAGVLAALAVAVLFLIVDLISGQAFNTPRQLGSLLLSGAIVPLSRMVDVVTPVALYTVFHFAAFVAAGIVVAFVVHFTIKKPIALVLFVILFFAFEVFFTGLVAFLDVQSVGTIAAYQVAAGNIVAAVVMALYFRARYPHLRTIGQALSDDDE